MEPSLLAVRRNFQEVLDLLPPSEAIVDQAISSAGEPEGGFVKAMLEPNADEMTRMVYADYLEEVGDTEAAIAQRLAAKGYQWKAVDGGYGSLQKGRELCALLWHSHPVKRLIVWSVSSQTGTEPLDFGIEGVFDAVDCLHLNLWQSRYAIPDEPAS